MLLKFTLFTHIKICIFIFHIKLVFLLFVQFVHLKLFLFFYDLLSIINNSSMKYQILILKKKFLPLMLVLFSSQTIFSLILNPPYFRSSPDASACISYSEKWSFFLDYSISYDFCLVSVCSTVLCFFKKCWAFFHTSW